jgi:galactokinase
MDTLRLRRVFASSFGGDPRLFVAPGRVNLIGEHTDYNDGFVLPAAIDLGTVTAARVRTDRRVRVHSVNFGETAEFDLDKVAQPRRGHWLDHVEGVARAIEALGTPLCGADLALESDVPLGAGLASSAALQISVGLALASLASAPIDPLTLARAGQRAEHEFVGTECGIMDHLCATLGLTDHALSIDCRSHTVTPVPLDPDIAIVVCDSTVRRELARSEYNSRRAECEKAVLLLCAVMPGIAALRDVDVSRLEEVESLLPDPLRKRCRHVVTENDRTERAAEALKSADRAALRGLMAASHRSLRDDYEVSCPELDALVEIADEIEGSCGHRMTGAGFGGCTVHLVASGEVARFRRTIAGKFERAFGRVPATFATRASGGAHELSEQ